MGPRMANQFSDGQTPNAYNPTPQKPTTPKFATRVKPSWRCTKRPRPHDLHDLEGTEDEERVEPVEVHR